MVIRNALVLESDDVDDRKYKVSIEIGYKMKRLSYSLFFYSIFVSWKIRYFVWMKILQKQ